MYEHRVAVQVCLPVVVILQTFTNMSHLLVW